MDYADELKKINDKISKARSDRDRLQGQLDSLSERLKEEFGVDSIEEAKQLLNKKEKEVAVIESSLQKAIKKLKEDFDL